MQVFYKRLVQNRYEDEASPKENQADLKENEAKLRKRYCSGCAQPLSEDTPCRKPGTGGFLLFGQRWRAGSLARLASAQTPLSQSQAEHSSQDKHHYRTDSVQAGDGRQHRQNSGRPRPQRLLTHRPRRADNERNDHRTQTANHTLQGRKGVISKVEPG